MSAIFPNSLSEPVYEHLASQYSAVLPLVESWRKDASQTGNTHDSAIDHFMYDFVGDLDDARRAPIMIDIHPEKGVLEYKSRVFFGFTDSATAVLLRGCSEVDPEDPAAYFLVTGNMRTGATQRWYVTHAEKGDAYLEARFGLSPTDDDPETAGYLRLSSQANHMQLPDQRRPERIELAHNVLSVFEFRRKLDYYRPGVAKLIEFMSTVFGHVQEVPDAAPVTLGG